jgi:diaminopimelate epimerase
VPLKFWKVEAIGNDFPLIHLEDVAAESLPELAIRLCDRRFGIGGDGLLAAGMEERDLRLRMFNPDGTEDFCGNGLRCAAVHAYSQGWVGEAFAIRHRDRRVPTRFEPDGRVATTLGVASYRPDDIPLIGPEYFDATIWSGMDSGVALSLFGSVLTTGSTHTIIPTAALPDDDTFRSISAKIEVDPKFPERTSVIWSQEVGPMEIRIRIWERGVGETQGCGTGSSAAAIDYLRRKAGSGEVLVHNPGGDVRVQAHGWQSPLTITGEAREVYRGDWQGDYAPATASSVPTPHRLPEG